MTVNELTSTIRNNVADGLSGNISNQSFSTQQLEEEIDLERAGLIQRHIMSGGKINPNFLYQTIEKLHITCLDLSSNVPCGFSTHSDAPAIKIPAIASTPDNSAVEYFGLMNKQERFIVYFDTDDMANHKYRQKTKDRPFIWIDTTLDENGEMTAFFLNAGKHFNLKFAALRAMYDHPTRINNTTGDAEYPAPASMQKDIISNLTEKYIRYYRQLNIAPVANTQSDTLNIK